VTIITKLVNESYITIIHGKAKRKIAKITCLVWLVWI